MMDTLRNFKAVQWYQILLALSIGIFCVAPPFISPMILLLLLFTFFQFYRKKMIFQWTTIATWFVLFYACYVVGLFFTDHMTEALGNLERRMVYVLFPLLFSFRFKEKLNLQPIVLSFIGGLVIAAIMGLFHSYQIYQKMGDFNNSFGSTNFSYIHHPTYFSAFFVCAFWMAREGWKRNWKYFSWTNLTLFVLFTLIIQFFCFSFAGLLFLFAMFVYLILKGIRQVFPKWVFWMAIIMSPILPVLAYYSNIHIQIQVDELRADVARFAANPQSIFERKEGEVLTGNKTRLVMWTVSAEEIWHHPLGAGTSNFDDVLSARLNQHGWGDVAKETYNPHNQFLQVGVELGIIGLFIFLGLFIVLFRKAWEQKNYVLMFILINLVFNMVFESMLQRQSGIVFYTFWIFLLLQLPNRIYNASYGKSEL